MEHRPTALLISVGVVVALVAFAPAMAPGAAPPQRLAHFDLMPKPARLPDGTLAAYFLPHRGPGLPPMPDVQHVTVRHSRDHGRTWDEPRQLFALPAEEGGFGYFERLVDRDGEVHFFFLCDANTGVVRMRPESQSPRVEPLARQRLDVWHVRSTDGRSKWTTPKRIWEGRAGDLQSVTQLRSGRIVLPLSYFANRNWGQRGEGFAAFTYMGQFDNTALFSDDGGATWKRSESVLRTPTPGLSAYGAVEPVAIELNDGRVWTLLRTQMGRFYESFSTDGGIWTPATPSSIFSSDSPAGLVRLPDKRLVMIWNNCLRYPYAQGARNVLHAAVSSDDGKSWRGYREILRDPHRNEPPPPSGDHGVSYPFAALGHDGRIVYSLWVQTGDGRSLESFDPDWLTEPTQTDDFSGDLEAWSVYGTKGVELASHEQSKDGKVLTLRKTDAEWPSSAVRNFPFGERGSVNLRMLVEPGFGGATVQLTDHFSVPFDLEDQFYSLYDLRIGPGGEIEGGKKLPIGQWVDLELRWDAEKRVCEVLANGESVATLPQQRASAGPSYLRVRALSGEPAEGRLILDTVHVDVADKQAR